MWHKGFWLQDKEPNKNFQDYKRVNTLGTWKIVWRDSLPLYLLPPSTQSFTVRFPLHSFSTIWVGLRGPPLLPTHLRYLSHRRTYTHRRAHTTSTYDYRCRLLTYDLPSVTISRTVNNDKICLSLFRTTLTNSLYRSHESSVFPS